MAGEPEGFDLTVVPPNMRHVESRAMKHVAFEGYCSGGKLRDLYRGASFVVVPSEWYENAPMSVIEAFAYGKPVIGSRIGGIPELVIPECTGLLFEAGDHAELSKTVKDLWADREMVVRMGRQARELVETEFSADRHLAGLLDIYRSVVGEQS